MPLAFRALFGRMFYRGNSSFPYSNIVKNVHDPDRLNEIACSSSMRENIHADWKDFHGILAKDIAIGRKLLPAKDYGNENPSIHL